MNNPKPPQPTAVESSQDSGNKDSWNKDSWTNYVEDFRRAGHQTVDWIAEYLSSVSDRQVLAQTQPGQLLDALPASAPAQGESFDAILRDFDRIVMPAVTQ